MAAVIEVKAIKPKSAVGMWKYVRQDLLNTLRREGTKDRKLLAKTTKTWSKRPRFTSKVSLAGGIAKVTTTTDSQIWNWLDQGTRPHIITPRGQGYPLRFRVGGKPKTRPRYVTSYKGSPGKQWRSARQVMHPGTKAREWSTVIPERRQPEFAREIQASVKRGMERAFKK